MRILMCTDGQSFAEEAIRFGGKLANELDSDVTILYVRPGTSEMGLSRFKKERKTREEWSREVPDLECLWRAKEILAGAGLVRPASLEGEAVRYTFRESAGGGVGLHAVGQRPERIQLRLRKGEAAAEILEAADQEKYDLILTGSRGHKGMARYFVGSTALRIAEFAPCSVLIAKNIQEDHNFLICTDGSRWAERTELFGARVAQALGAQVTLLSVASEESERKAAQEKVRRAEMILAQLGVKAEVKVEVGRPSEEIIDKATDHYIVVMGASGSSVVKRFFLGSVPLKVIEYGTCPVLLVRDRPSSEQRGKARPKV